MTTKAIKVRDIVMVLRDEWQWLGMVTGIVAKPGGGKDFEVVPLDTKMQERCSHRLFRARHIVGHWQRRQSA